MSSPFPTRPVLAPGLTVFRSRAGELQIGRSQRHRLRVADTPAVRRTLEMLERGEALAPDAETTRMLEELVPVLRDGDALVHPGVPAAEVAAITLRHPATARIRIEARKAAQVRVLGDLGLDPRPLLDRAGLALEPPGSRLPPTAALVLSAGDLDRDVTDHLVRSRVPHLIVRAIESEIRIGPFVSSGSTACLRCLDAHLSVADPTYPALLAEPVGVPRCDGVAEPLDQTLAMLALAWAVGDLVRFTEGERPSTWSATVTLTGTATSITTTPWTRHPGCGCSWASEQTGAAQPSVTMGA